MISYMYTINVGTYINYLATVKITKNKWVFDIPAEDMGVIRVNKQALILVLLFDNFKVKPPVKCIIN